MIRKITAFSERGEDEAIAILNQRSEGLGISAKDILSFEIKEYYNDKYSVRVYYWEEGEER